MPDSELKLAIEAKMKNKDSEKRKIDLATIKEIAKVIKKYHADHGDVVASEVVSNCRELVPYLDRVINAQGPLEFSQDTNLKVKFSAWTFAACVIELLGDKTAASCSKHMKDERYKGPFKTTKVIKGLAQDSCSNCAWKNSIGPCDFHKDGPRAVKKQSKPREKKVSKEPGPDEDVSKHVAFFLGEAQGLSKKITPFLAKRSGEFTAAERVDLETLQGTFQSLAGKLSGLVDSDFLDETPSKRRREDSETETSGPSKRRSGRGKRS